jgi:olefin beta-lactone synthetase
MDERELKARNIASHLDRTASSYPDRPAVIHPFSSTVGVSCETTSFSQLHDTSLSYAEQLKKGGVIAGDRVLMMVPPGADLLASVYALFRLRALPIFIDPGMKRQHLLQCIERSQPKHMLGIPKAHWISRLFPKAFASIKKRFSLGKSAYLALADVLRPIRPNTSPDDYQDPSGEELAAILFTSGSTGPPKGVQYRVRHFHAQIEMLKSHFDINPKHLDLPLLPVFALFNPALGMGSVIPRVNAAAPASLNPAHIVDLIQRFQIQHSFGAPVLWKKISRYLESKSIVLQSLEKVLMAGAPVPPSLLEVMRKVTPNGKVLTPYGATEGLPICVIDGETILRETADLTRSGKGICVGSPLEQIKLRIEPLEHVDQSDFANTATGVIGEILVSGPVVTDTYDALPEETLASKLKFEGQVWHRMGDVGYLDQKGKLWFCGRLGHIVFHNSTALFSVCTEAHFNEHPDVERSALIQVKKNNEVVPALALELKNPGGVNIQTLKHELLSISEENHLETITNYYLHPSFPVDVRHNAKIHRKELGAWAAHHQPL